MKRKEAEGRAEGREKGGRREGGRKEEEGGRDLEGPGRAEPRRGSKSQGLASGSGGTEATLEESGVSLGFGQNRANARRVELQPPPPAARDHKRSRVTLLPAAFFVESGEPG